MKLDNHFLLLMILCLFGSKNPLAYGQQTLAVIPNRGDTEWQVLLNNQPNQACPLFPEDYRFVATKPWLEIIQNYEDSARYRVFLSVSQESAPTIQNNTEQSVIIEEISSNNSISENCIAFSVKVLIYDVALGIREAQLIPNPQTGVELFFHQLLKEPESNNDVISFYNRSLFIAHNYLWTNYGGGGAWTSQQNVEPVMRFAQNIHFLIDGFEVAPHEAIELGLQAPFSNVFSYTYSELALAYSKFSDRTKCWQSNVSSEGVVQLVEVDCEFDQVDQTMALLQ